ncbi:hypothetical protein PanWU01x14_109930 [Parasponia andersonii]|uniref:Uncharacterized protein n=1 Tax=Parasponia andersonii TaxID=3476 RepID=A0A2P5CZ72_PARAD|nr:hypothetical protein PanWU01x14_109930 [Parasponia andersonii]
MRKVVVSYGTDYRETCDSCHSPQDSEESFFESSSDALRFS